MIEKHGGPDEVKIIELDLPRIRPNEVLIKVKVFALNRLDIWTRQGMPTLNLSFPHIGSSEFVGIIEKVGDEVVEFNPGDRVVINAGIACRRCLQCRSGDHTLCAKFKMIGEHIWGGAAEYAKVPWTNLLKIPDNVKLIDVVATSLTALTVYRMLKRANFKRGMLVLVVGAGGGIGTMAVQMTYVLGGRVIAITSSKEKEVKVKELGAELVINYKELPNWGKEVWNYSKNEGVDVVLDSTGEIVWEASLRSLRKGGRLVTCGATSGGLGTTNIHLVFWKQLSIIGSTMASDSEFREAMALIFSGKIHPVIDSTFQFNAIKEAHERQEDPNHIGKILIQIED